MSNAQSGSKLASESLAQFRIVTRAIRTLLGENMIELFSEPQ